VDPDGSNYRPGRLIRSFLGAEPAAAGHCMVRVLEPFAKRDLIPDSLRASRDGDMMRAEVALQAMPLGMVHLVAGNLGQIVGVRRVEAMEGRVVRLAA
jgi:hypothetical protein